MPCPYMPINIEGIDYMQEHALPVHAEVDSAVFYASQ